MIRINSNGATCRNRTGILCMASRYNSRYTNAAPFEYIHNITEREVDVKKKEGRKLPSG